MSTPILFDGTILGRGPATGVARALLTTLEAYARLTPHPCILLTTSTAAFDPIPGVEHLPILPEGRAARHRALRHAARDHHAALFHSPVVALPARLPCPAVATVHDVPWLHPDLRGEPGTRFSQRLALRAAVRRAAALVVPSQATRADLVAATGIAPDAIDVLPHGVAPPPGLRHTETAGASFLVLGDTRPRKNLPRVQAAHARAMRLHPDLPPLERLGPPDRYVEEATKWHHLATCRALIHCALLEGFGLPVLEALALGTPVVCSDTTSLPEVAGAAVLRVDPRDEAAIAAALVRIHTDPALRQDLTSRGPRQAAAFTPTATARGWLALHARLGAG